MAQSKTPAGPLRPYPNSLVTRLAEARSQLFYRQVTGRLWLVQRVELCAKPPATWRERDDAYESDGWGQVTKISAVKGHPMPVS